VIDRCKDAGITNIIIVVNPRSDSVRNYFDDGGDFGVSIQYVEQPKPEGIGHAVGLTEGIVETPFVVYLGDELYIDSDHRGFIQSFDYTKFAALIGIMRVDDENLIRKNYSVEIDPETHIIQNLVEKPVELTNNILGCGSYIFNETVFEAIRNTPRSKKNEIEITDTLNTIREMGPPVGGYFLGGHYLNVTYPTDIAIST
jgi:dTDP-glucose pyrophosphorylase